MKVTILFLVLSISNVIYGIPKNCNTKNISVTKGDTIEIQYNCWEEGDYEVVRLKNNELHGIFESFYPSGAKRQVCNYVNGKEEGIKKGWLKDGFLSVYKPYKNGLPVDTHNVWYENKKQESIIVYDSNGKKNGWLRKWFENGVMKDSSLFLHGALVEQHLFYENGKPVFMTKMKDDGVIIQAMSWSEKGAVTGEVKNGNGKIILPGKGTSPDTLIIKNGKVQNESFYFTHDQ